MVKSAHITSEKAVKPADKKPSAPISQHSTRQQDVSPLQSLQRGIMPANLRPADIIQLQRSVGNRAVGALLNRLAPSPTVIQTKLTMNPPDDQYEREADHVAAKVVRQLYTPQNNYAHLLASTTTSQRQFIGNHEEASRMSPAAQCKPDMSGTAVSSELEAATGQQRGLGQPLAENIRMPMEQAFGTTFSDVRVHTDAPAQTLTDAIGARACTLGRDVFFQLGAFDLNTYSGRTLIAHELVHVLQQRNERNAVPQSVVGSVPTTNSPVLQAKLDWTRAGLVKRAGHPFGRSSEYQAIVAALKHYEQVQGRATKYDANQLHSESQALSALHNACIRWLQATGPDRQLKERAPERLSAVKSLSDAVRAEETRVTNAFLEASRSERAKPTSQSQAKEAPAVEQEVLLVIDDDPAQTLKKKLKDELLKVYSQDLGEGDQARRHIVSLENLKLPSSQDEGAQQFYETHRQKGILLLAETLRRYHGKVDFATLASEFTDFPSLKELIREALLTATSTAKQPTRKLEGDEAALAAFTETMEGILAKTLRSRRVWQQAKKTLAKHKLRIANQTVDRWKRQAERFVAAVGAGKLLRRLSPKVLEYQTVKSRQNKLLSESEAGIDKGLDLQAIEQRSKRQQRQLEALRARLLAINPEVTSLGARLKDNSLLNAAQTEVRTAVEATTLATEFRSAAQALKLPESRMTGAFNAWTEKLIQAAAETELADF